MSTKPRKNAITGDAEGDVLSMSPTTSGDDAEKRFITFRSLEQEVYLSLIFTASRLSSQLDVLLKQYGLTQAQYNVLRILRGVGSSGLGRNQIRDRLVTAMPDVTRLLDRMELAGLVSRRRCPTDRRQVATVLTAKSLALVKKLDQPLDKLHQAQVAGLTVTQQREMLAALKKLRSNARSF